MLRRPAMICMDTVHLVNKNMQKESIIIKEVRQNAGVLKGQDIKVHHHTGTDSLLIEVKDNSMNINALVFMFTLTGSLLQMVQLTEARTIVDVPLLPNEKCLMNIQIGKDVLTWTITKL
ncbi:hypothetical protein [uncultured Bacteroides sp.]|uniref:hypothetical protein n=1 Tax=uncultured Bacteroides sp. TaxID=162156 RepID=UPI0037494F71